MALALRSACTCLRDCPIALLTAVRAPHRKASGQATMIDQPSDDLGRSFHAASGKRLKLPLTVNPIPSHNASISSGPLKARYDLWASLVKALP